LSDEADVVDDHLTSSNSAIAFQSLKQVFHLVPFPVMTAMPLFDRVELGKSPFKNPVK
jgi:hypothetical protein